MIRTSSSASGDDPRLYHFVTILGALGGLLLLLSSVLPLLSPSKPGEAEGVLWLEDYRQRLKALRQDASRPEAPLEVKQLMAVVEPSLSRLDEFLIHPSGYRLWFVLRDAERFCGMALSFSGALSLQKQEIALLELAQKALFWVLLFLVTIPLLGGYHVLRGVLMRFREHVFLALSLSFFMGLAYTLLSGLVIFGVPAAQRAYLGSAPYFLFAGGALLLFCGIFGVSRKTWWKAYLLDVAGLGVIVYFAIRLGPALLGSV